MFINIQKFDFIVSTQTGLFSVLSLSSTVEMISVRYETLVFGDL